MVVGFITTYAISIYINKNILGLQLSQDWDVYTGTFVYLTMKLTKLTLQAPYKYNPNFSFFLKKRYILLNMGSHDCMVVGFITTYAISAHHH
jgi:hypothetical protein